MGVKSINWPEAIYQFGIVEKSWRKYVQFCPIMSKVNLLFESWTKISWTKLDKIGQNWTWPPPPPVLESPYVPTCVLVCPSLCYQMSYSGSRMTEADATPNITSYSPINHWFTLK